MACRSLVRCAAFLEGGASQGGGGRRRAPPAAEPAAPVMSHVKGVHQAMVVVGEKESVEAALRRFRRGVIDSDCIMETRRRRYFEDAQDVIKRKEAKSRRIRSKARTSLSHRPASPSQRRSSRTCARTKPPRRHWGHHSTPPMGWKNNKGERRRPWGASGVGGAAGAPLAARATYGRKTLSRGSARVRAACGCFGARRAVPCAARAQCTPVMRRRVAGEGKRRGGGGVWCNLVSQGALVSWPPHASAWGNGAADRRARRMS